MATIDVHEIAVHYRAAGEGQGVILLHSTSSSGGQWKSLMERLSPKYRLLAPDLFGYGRTAHWPQGRADLIEDEVAIVKALMGLVPGAVHVVGHSYGGHVAARTALAYRDRVVSLTLIEPAMHYLLAQAGEREAYAEIRSIADSVLKSIKEGQLETAAAIFLDYWVGPGALNAIQPERKTAVVQSMRKLEYEWPFSLVRENASIAELREVSTPTLLICGGKTTFALTRLTDLLARTLPSCKVVEIAGAGHMSPITHPEPVNAAVEEHIECHG